MTAQGPLPPIHTWWSSLTAVARGEVLADRTAALTPRVREEICRMTGLHPGDGVRLDHDDLQFLHLQTDVVG